MSILKEESYLRTLAHVCCAMGLSMVLHVAAAYGGTDINVLEERVASKDPAVASAAVRELLEQADKADGLAVMRAAMFLFNAGKKDDAGFWFYAGQLRARSMPQLAGENSQIIDVYLMVSEPINTYAMRDVGKMTSMIGKVLAWDEKTFNDWAWANDLDIRDAELISRRKRARDGLAEFAKELASNRAKYEEQARASPGDAQISVSTSGLGEGTRRPSRWTPVATGSDAKEPAASKPFFVVAERSGAKGGQRLGKAEIVSRADLIAGREAQFWVQRYYEWLEKTKKASKNVQKDESGNLCNSLQNGSVWFLTNFQYGKVTRSCEIPRDVYIMIPALEGLVTAARGKTASCEELVGGVKKFVTQGAGVRLSIDGEELKNAADYEGATGCVERIDPDNPQNKQVIAVHGYWVFLKPLSTGDHHIEFKGEIGKGNYSSFIALAHDVTYMATVK